MEPPVAVANVKDGKAEIWAPVQSPGGTREDVAKTLGIPEDNVTVNVTLLGGGFGRKSKCDFAIEAALLSKELGAPVKVQWTREDDVQSRLPPHRLGGTHRSRPRQERQGDGLAAPQRRAKHRLDLRGRHRRTSSALELGMGLIDMPFEIANIQCENPEAAAHTRIGWFRSVSNIPRAFAVQSMVGELAHATSRDQKDMLLELIGSPRIVNLSSVKDLWNYGEPYDSYPIDTARLAQGGRDGRGKGRMGTHACRRATGSASPCTAASSATSRPLSRWRSTTRASSRCRGSIPRSIAAPMSIPERIQSQIEGAAIMGLSLAKYGEITFKDGKVQQKQFRRLPGDPDGRGAARDQRPHRAARLPTRRRAASANPACRRSRRR